MAKDIFNRNCEKLEADHIWPLSKSGSKTKANIQMLCRLSNEEKADKTRGSINGYRFSITPIGADENGRTIGKMKVWKK